MSLLNRHHSPTIPLSPASIFQHHRRVLAGCWRRGFHEKAVFLDSCFRNGEHKLHPHIMNRLLVLVVACLCINWAFAIDKEHIFKDEDVVPLFVNKVGPYANPSESYEFYSLPLCRPKNVQHEHHTLGEKLEGDRKQSSAYEIRFKGIKRMHSDLI